MAWTINEIENTITITPELAAELNPIIAELCPDHFYEDGEPFTEHYVRNPETFRSEKTGMYAPYFNPDHSEHMDWLTQSEEVMRRMAAAGVEGRVCFGDLDSGTDDPFWGVEFASGQYRKLTGKVIWTPGTSHPG